MNKKTRDEKIMKYQEWEDKKKTIKEMAQKLIELDNEDSTSFNQSDMSTILFYNAIGAIKELVNELQDCNEDAIREGLTETEFKEVKGKAISANR